AGAAAQLHLFGSEPVTERVSPQRVIDVDPAALRTHFRPSSEPLQFDLHTRGGFFKLQLSGPPNAFGHQAYPQLLTHTVSANARHKYRKPLPLPNPPYTPMVERLRFDYRASSSIHLRSEVRAAPGEVGADVERVFHLHPFGMEEIHPAAGDRPHGVLPPCGPDGNLCIGLAAGQLQGALSLLFHLRAESALQLVAAVPPVRWYYLAANRWWPLAPSQVLSDTTAGFLTSGIVTLDVPAEIRSDNSVLPGGLFWLRASAGHGFEAFAGLYGVHAQAVRAVRVMAAGAPAAPVPMAAGTVKEVMVNVPGLSGVVQVGTSFGLRAHEEQALMRARAGERLQHKNRACTPWDIERLVLARFPSVFKVKCFAQPLDATQPGEVLVVVVPATRRNEPLESTLGPRVNAIELMRMAEHLQRAASPFARIRVRNASYERIQVRCNLQLVRGTHGGQALQRLNQRINEYLSPWHDEGYQARFDWTVRSEDIEACIRSAPGVEAVTQLSLLHIAADDSGVYTLGDTARPGSDGRNTVMPGHVQARMPWSLALPMPNHLLGVADATEPQDAPAPATGISKLAVGGTFIVGG
ncbi:MAG TPA: baseplate J/gp47 family protein, partial [Rhizobacter sp.]|nr:baseplate J/gp47 family protein [Rhizobacter sp.]